MGVASTLTKRFLSSSLAAGTSSFSRAHELQRRRKSLAQKPGRTAPPKDRILPRSTLPSILSP
jgi:hypothetical protein